MKSRAVVVCAVAGIAASVSTAQSTKFLRYPSPANDGRIAFSYHGDIWIVDADGANPQRLTAHVARDENPRFSPDGKHIAFDSDRMGNDDLYVMPVTGGEPKQITFDSTGDRLVNWMPDGKGLLFATSRGNSLWGAPLYVAPLDGTIPTPLKMDKGSSGMVSQDGSMVAFNRNGFRYWRKGYRGNWNTDIYVMPTLGGEIKQLTDLDMKDFRNHTQDAHPMWGSDGMIYFMSEKDGLFNLWRMKADGSKQEQVTFHDGDGIQYPSISPDGSIITYESEFEIYRYDVATRKTARVPIELSFDPKDTLMTVTSTNGNPDGLSPNHDGSQVVVGHHGELYLVPSDPQVGEKTRITDSVWRDRYQQFSPDGTMIAFVSDQSREEEIWIYNVESRESRQLTHQESLKSEITWSPDSKKIVWESDLRLYMIDVASGEMSQLAYNPEGGFDIGAFSNDGKYLVYNREDPALNDDVYIFDIENRTETNVTDHIFSDRAGFLTPDHSHVVFSSNRSGTWELYAVSLTKMTEDPNDPMVKARKDEKKPSRGDEKKDDDKKDADKSDDGEKKDEEKAETKPLEVDLEGIDKRAQRISSGSGNIFNFFPSRDGKLVYFTRGSELLSVKIDGSDQKSLGDGGFGGLSMSGDGKKFFFERSGGLYSMSASGGRPSKIDFSLRVIIDQRAEWEQVFEECWRVMKYRFYDKNMHGVDWAAVREKYRPMLANVGENQDLYDLANEMIGELNASHTGVSGPQSHNMERLYSTQHLGFDIVPDNGVYRISYIYPDGPADHEWIELNVGDVVQSINGTNIADRDNYEKLLLDPLNEYVSVRVATPESADDGTEMMTNDRVIRINTVGSLSGIMYNAWVDSRRKLVDEWSNGKIGYVHIQAMNGPSLAKFQTEIDQFWNKNGMIIDIRYNGGGNIDQQLIDILERQPYEYWNSRLGGRAAGRRPRQAIAGPKVMLINGRSASDSEVTPQGFRDLKLGTIVGNPTMGAVIATGSYGLLNGGSIRTPGALVTTYDPTNEHNYGINLENFGVAPDVWVENSPQDELDGYDRELHVAVQTALEQLAKGTWQYGEDK
ncbi:MAG: PD40 domain-containing protein [Phycisphaeraceae bacterium]|nr:PD40 domain-containing protein [Phycisphaerales bacterium]MCB9860679.1 PD40 domain-containing protein [Phycisphaeraceae bacterium]